MGCWKAGLLLLLLGCLAQLLAQLFWLIFAPAELPTAQQVAALQAANHEQAGRAPLQVAGRTLQAIDIAALGKLAVFGRVSALADKPAAAAVIAPENDAEETRLSLILSGVVGSNRTADSRAIITDGGSQSLYAPGDELVNHDGVSLAKVLPDRVILDNKGRYESLWLYSDEPLPQQNSKAPSITPQRALSAQRNRGAPVASSSASDGPAQNLDQLIKFSLARRGGDVIGYRVRAGQDASLFEKLGLQTNDIVTAVNGAQLDSSARAMEVYRSIRSATAAQLEILRDSQTLQLTIELP